MSSQDFLENVLEQWTSRLKDLRSTSLEMDRQEIESCIKIGLRCVLVDATGRPTAKEIMENLNEWDNMNLTVTYDEPSPTGQEIENWSKASLLDQTIQNDDALPRQNVSVENGPSNSFPAEVQPEQVVPSIEPRTCAGCKNSIGHRHCFRSGHLFWHFRCFRCFPCDKPIYDSKCHNLQFSMRDGQLYHRSCYIEHFFPKCDVCNNFIQVNRNGVIEYRAHPFWRQKYCPSHEDDGTFRCYSCERLEPREVQFITLDDERALCLECLHTAVMDTSECQQLYVDVQTFFEHSGIKIEKHIPLLLVEKQVLNEAMEAEKNGHHHLETRGLCLSEERIVRIILRRPSIGPGNNIVDMLTGPYEVSRQCEVTAILILFGLPRLLTGSILAHEMMHAYLRLKGYQALSTEVEEGICQVVSHKWLGSEITTISSSGNAASSSVQVASSYSAPTYFKKDTHIEFEQKLGAFFKRQIETDCSVPYGDGFREGDWAVDLYGLERILDHIKMEGSFPKPEMPLRRIEMIGRGGGGERR